ISARRPRPPSSPLFPYTTLFRSFVVAPFCAAALLLGMRYLPHGAPGGAPVNRSGKRLDIAGLVLLSVAVLCGLNGLVHLHDPSRSEEHTSELQSLAQLVCRRLLE